MTHEAEIKFELNREYTSNRGDKVTFVRRTAKCLFDADGNKYLINPYIQTEDGKYQESVSVSKFHKHCDTYASE